MKYITNENLIEPMEKLQDVIDIFRKLTYGSIENPQVDPYAIEKLEIYNDIILNLMFQIHEDFIEK